MPVMADAFRTSCPASAVDYPDRTQPLDRTEFHAACGGRFEGFNLRILIRLNNCLYPSLKDIINRARALCGLFPMFGSERFWISIFPWKCASD